MKAEELREIIAKNTRYDGFWDAMIARVFDRVDWEAAVHEVAAHFEKDE